MGISVIIMMIFPIPALLLDIMIVLNLLFALGIFFASLTIKTEYFPLLPTLILLSIVFGLTVILSATKLILIKGADFDGVFIRSISFLAAGGAGKIYHLIAGFALFIVIIFIQMRIIARGAIRYSEIIARFILTHQVILDSECTYISQKKALQKELDFVLGIEGSCKFISGNEKIRLFIILINILLGIFIGTVLNGESVVYSIKIYIPLAIANGLLSIFHASLLSLAVRRRFKTYNYAVLKTIRNTSENCDISPDPLSIELGYGLIPLVEKEKGAVLLEQIQNLRKSLADNSGFTIPKIRIVDNSVLQPYEYLIKMKGVEIGRGIINTELKNEGVFNHLKELIIQYAAEISTK